jgi:hypothetical protein
VLYDPENHASVRLSFDRPIDVSRLDPARITVDDASGAGFTTPGTGVAGRPDDRTVVVALTETGSAEGPTLLHATTRNGIAAADDDRGRWAGAEALELPYPGE